MRIAARRLLPLLLLLGAPALAAKDPAPPPGIGIGRWLALDGVDARGRAPFNPNTPFDRYLLDRDAPPPKEGEVVKGTSGEASWRAVAAGEDGKVEDESGAWFHGEATAEEGGVYLAHLDRASALFVNGAGFTGDVYGIGAGPVPVALRKGLNRVFVVGPRGPWSLRFEKWEEGRSPVLAVDAMLPDPVEGDEGGLGYGSVRVVNPSTEWTPAPFLSVSGFGPDDPPPPRGLEPLPLAPLWTGKAAVTTFWGLRGPEVAGRRIGFQVLTDSTSTHFTLDVRRADEARRVTFTSSIDGSVQYYAVLDPAGEPATGPVVATVLSTHGAGVEALGQARSYSRRPGFRIVAPTNRRPFGFDWQDWGRIDAYEVLSRALAEPDADPHAVFLTGHSMGGHGAWNLAANDPDRWAAVAPSAGWCSFDTYGGGPRPRTELADLWIAADPGSRTEDLVANLAPLPVFVLHGTADDNVPLSEATDMIARLEKAGGRPLHHFQEGAGHWWDGDAAPGADCVDWPGIFDLFRRCRIPESPETLEFVSADPVVDALHHWVMVHQPLVYGKPFRVKGTRSGGKFVLETENVRTLTLLPVEGVVPVSVTIDGASVPPPGPDAADTWVREGDAWKPLPGPDPSEKNAGRAGPFKRAFDHRFVLVTGTRGTEAENRENLELARYHASQWWYRANGSAAIVRDVDLLGRPEEFKGRNLVLYGNADDNAAWQSLLPPGGPVEVRRGSVRVGDRTWKGDDLGAVFVRPRPGDDFALVGAVASTGDRGTRAGYGLLPFVSGVGYPDWAVFGAGFLRSGDGGVRAAGWFDHRWDLQAEGSFFREERR